MRQELIIKKRPGVAALLIVLILAGAGLAISLMLANRGLNGLELGLDRRGATKALDLAETCVADTVQFLKRNPGYMGDSLFWNSDYCIITVNTLAADSHLISVKASKNNYVRVLDEVVNITGTTSTIESWAISGNY